MRALGGELETGKNANDQHQIFHENEGKLLTDCELL
jgi:hypothetical protein